jgi:sulfur-carrier protein
MIRVHFSSELRRLTGGVADLEVDAPTVRRLVADLEARFPGIGPRLSEGTSVAINGEIVADAMFESLPDGAEVHFIETLKGG